MTQFLKNDKILKTSKIDRFFRNIKFVSKCQKYDRIVKIIKKWENVINDKNLEMSKKWHNF